MGSKRRQLKRQAETDPSDLLRDAELLRELDAILTQPKDDTRPLMVWMQGQGDDLGLDDADLCELTMETGPGGHWQAVRDLVGGLLARHGHDRVDTAALHGIEYHLDTLAGCYEA